MKVQCSPVWSLPLCRPQVRNRSIAELTNRKESVQCCALKLAKPAAVIKALRTAVLPEHSFELLDKKKFSNGDTETMDKFQIADLLVVDYGKDWQGNMEVGIRVGQRHSSVSEDISAKLKHSIALIETSETEVGNFSYADFSFESSNSYRIPCVPFLHLVCSVTRQLIAFSSWPGMSTLKVSCGSTYPIRFSATVSGNPVKQRLPLYQKSRLPVQDPPRADGRIRVRCGRWTSSSKL